MLIWVGDEKSCDDEDIGSLLSTKKIKRGNDSVSKIISKLKYICFLKFPKIFVDGASLAMDLRKLNLL